MYDFKTFLAHTHTPLVESSREPPKGSDKDKRSGSMSEDTSGDLSPSISFSEGHEESGHNKEHVLELSAAITIPAVARKVKGSE